MLSDLGLVQADTATGVHICSCQRHDDTDAPLRTEHPTALHFLHTDEKDHTYSSVRPCSPAETGSTKWTQWVSKLTHEIGRGAIDRGGTRGREGEGEGWT